MQSQALMEIEVSQQLEAGRYERAAELDLEQESVQSYGSIEARR